MNGVAAAVARKLAVSSRLERVWTRTVASTPAARASGARSAGANAPPDRGQLVGQPRVVGPGGVPEVVVGVDDHAVSAGTGASAGDEALGAELVPQVRRDRRGAGGPGTRRGGRPAGRRRPAPRRRDGPAGTGSRPPGAGRRGVRRPPPSRRARSTTVGRRGPVVEPGARPRIGQDAAVHHAADDDARRPAPRTRQELGQGLLVEQRVAAGDEERRPCRSRGRTGPASPTGSCRRRWRGRRPARAAAASAG